MRQDLVRIGVVGVGYWGPNLIRNCAALKVLESVCDVDEAALAAVRRAYPHIATTTKLDELLARPIDAVIIATPAHLHAPMCMRAIAASKHVFVEKPLALNMDDGRKIALAARERGVSIFVGHLLLYHPAVKKMRSMIAEGVIGDVWHVRSRRLSLGKLRSHENVWWSFAPHDVAVILSIMGSEPEAASSSQSYAGTTTISDTAYADFQFSRGRSAHIEVSWLDPEKCARLDVFGQRGVLTLTDSRNDSSLVLRPFTVSSDESGRLVPLKGEEKKVAFDGVEPLQAEIQAFISSIVTGRPAETDVEQGIAVLRALSMAEEAAHKSGQQVPA